MFYEPDRPEYERVRHLYDALRYHLCCLAVLDGLNPGRVYVDDRAEPRTSFIVLAGGLLSGG